MPRLWTVVVWLGRALTCRSRSYSSLDILDIPQSSGRPGVKRKSVTRTVMLSLACFVLVSSFLILIAQ